MREKNYYMKEFYLIKKFISTKFENNEILRNIKIFCKILIVWLILYYIVIDF